MSATPSGAQPATKLQDTSSTSDSHQGKPAANAVALEEDDEFEDFPVEDWPAEDAEVPGGNAHLWEESWDDDDESEDFSKQLKEELEKVKANK